MVTVPLLLAGPVALAVVVGVRRSRARRHRRAVDVAAVALGADLARSVRSGRTLTEALEHARAHHDGPLAADLDAVLVRVSRGASLDEALGAAAADAPRSFVTLARACRLGARTAGDVAAVVDGAVASLGDELEVTDETAALTVQAWTSVWVLVALPLAGSAVFASVDPRVGGVLASTSAGRWCLVVGVGLDLVGLWCAGRLVTGAMR